MKTLYLEKRGCDFFDNDNTVKISNVGNYRVGTYDYSIIGKDGIKYIIEFTRGHKRHTRTENKRTGKLLKHPITEIVNDCCLNINTQYDEGKLSYRNTKMEQIVWDMGLDYTMENILKVVNMFSVDQYDKIEFIK